MSTPTMTTDAVRLLIRFANPEKTGTGAETTWAKAVEGGWKIDHPLWYSRSVNYGDVVRAVRRGDELVVAALVKRGGWATARVVFATEAQAEEVMRRLRFDHNAIAESYGHGQWAVSVPAAARLTAEAAILRADGSVDWITGPNSRSEPLDFTPSD
ncbi:hypothetical protein DVS28_b0364 (plasmid) [Euzebya pacifica]|uniref:Uncharacterized protein n=1 Tax=Euzebya pacifica TaxID=1608957 RepID=A0A346Y6N7_9ACTN|nr:DUF4265 domain-containing protein [Euzebya pacifica]AXV10134.1 hypothetical protein DVS28_b0364 [Euzebya pacifica]